MRSIHQKKTVVPGSQIMTSPDTSTIMFDKKGRVMWDMPNPVAVVMHPKRSFRGKGHNKIIQVEKIEVPVYRGVDARLARNLKSELRRKRRKEAERKEAGHIEIEVPENLMEEEND